MRLVPGQARWLLSLAAMVCPLPGQESSAGLHVPVQVSVNGLFTDRFDTRLPASLARLSEARQNSLSGAAGGLRLLSSPSVRWNERWFAHATVQVNTEPFFPYEAYHVDRPRARVRILQGYAGYSRAAAGGTVTLKAGQMATAFGDFTRRYSDTANPLIDAPAPYGSYLLLRDNELPCTNFDLQHQQQVHPNISAYHCAPRESYAYGLLPVSPYGVFGGELNWNAGRLDARLQLANSSPSNPRPFWAGGQSAQWAGGAGWSLAQGLRVGGSFFRGRWLEGHALRQLREQGIRNSFCACGVGLDAQYAWRRLAITGEWMRLEYQYPRFSRPPRVQYAYAEGKLILNPRAYFAFRAGVQRHGRVAAGESGRHDHVILQGHDDPSDASFQPNRRTLEVAVGLRPTRHFLLKVGHQWVQRSPSFGPRDHVLAVQLVTTVPDFWKGFR